MKLLSILTAILVATAAQAQMQVTVKKSGASKSSIDLSGISASGPAGQTFKSVLESDLLRSGWFMRAAPGQGELAVKGSVDSSVRAELTAFSKATQRTYLNKAFTGDAQGVRRLAHRAADEIIRAVTGKAGINSGRLALVGNRTGQKELYLADADGQGLIQLTRDKSVSISPNWSPDGNQIVYTAFLKRYPDVYLIELASGARKRIASYPGLNTGAAFSPDGRDVALILSKDGNPELYVKNLASGNTVRLTTTKGAEASPSWSPDGQRIVYVSDQPGTPQLYIVSRQGGAPRRLTSRGSQNVAPDWGPNNLIAYASLVGGRFQVCVTNPDNLETKQITSEYYNHEDPSWAPDGRHIACARSQNYNSKVYLLDTMGDPPLLLTDYPGDWYSPAWARGNE